ncbi:acetoacetyl-CoA synthetase [Sphingomonas sp. Root710]|uniref:acetoacetate--CoA ligase n=1 Tax=Sphingomonas sp. Root710 TaxID=1736594 RepID=UPI0006F73ADD|nr:acetoacetate--CoA ligase [Sphingomonas sp. Root710]KRB80730.1 acetoacetyl-CoA synthetase [Sphingomonas sp. Root710]
MPDNDAVPIPQMQLYREWLHRELGLEFEDYAAMWRWSTDDLEAFWRSIWNYHQIETRTPFAAALGESTESGATWFKGAQVNYARHVFRHVDSAETCGQPAIIADDESGQVRQLSWKELRRQTYSLALELRRLGVGRGDRVAAYLPNIPETVIGFLACASLGAVWALCSPDMGTPAVLDRLEQISPKILIAADGVQYGGKIKECSQAVGDMRAALPGLLAVLRVSGLCGATPISDAIDFATASGRTEQEVDAFEPEWVAFDHPLWVLYSSGTTGLPKAIVHSHGGILLAALAGHLHMDLGPSYTRNTLGDRFHWYTATGWVMWNQQVSALLSGTTICLFDGAPSGSKESPDWAVLWRFAARHRVTWFGAGAAYYIACRKAGVTLENIDGLGAIRALGSTGSPLPADVERWGSEQFATIGQPDIWWCNISGGTDLFAAFLAGNRELPAYPGKLQCRHLGAAVAAWDEAGHAVEGVVGELVCTRPFPSMPLYFWGDMDGSRYRSSYFNRWPGVWRHGDWLLIEPDGSCSISGRSDATINRNGLRMGTAEIYSAVERLPAVADTLLIDLEDGQGGSALLMFVVPTADGALDQVLERAMTTAIRATLSPRFVPDHFIAAPGIPRTMSGKKQELPIKRLFQGWPASKVINPDVIANPDILPWFIRQAKAWRDGKPLEGNDGAARSMGMQP